MEWNGRSPRAACGLSEPNKGASKIGCWNWEGVLKHRLLGGRRLYAAYALRKRSAPASRH